MQETVVTKSDDMKMFKVERVFAAPKETIWNAWTDKTVFEQWWGPIGWSTTVAALDFKPGGLLHYGMKCVDEAQGDWFGQTMWGKMVIEEVDEPNGFTYLDYFCDENGVVTEGMPVIRVVMQFEQVDGGTKVTSTTNFDDPKQLEQLLEMGMEHGLKQTWDRLAELVQQ